MALSFEQKIAIFEDIHFGMERYTIKPDKTNFRYKGKVIVREMRKDSIIAYVWGKDIAEFDDNYKLDDRGWIHVHDFSEEALRELMLKVLATQDRKAGNKYRRKTND